jgi:hypothetical protein
MRVPFSSVSEETSEEERVKSVFFHLFFSHKGVKMNKIKLITHERFNGKQSLEDLFFSAFQSESCQ